MHFYERNNSKSCKSLIYYYRTGKANSWCNIVISLYNCHIDVNKMVGFYLKFYFCGY